MTGWGYAPTPWLGYKKEFTHFCNTRLLSSIRFAQDNEACKKTSYAGGLFKFVSKLFD